MITQTLAILDSARDAAAVAIARNLSPRHQSLFDGAKGAEMALAAPHLFECDTAGNIAKLMLVLSGIGECGILADIGQLPPLEARLSTETDDFTLVRRHFRRFLVVRRDATGESAYFRYYDPRILRAFLPACTPTELKQFFGPVVSFHVQDEVPGFVRTFSIRASGALLSQQSPVDAFLARRAGESKCK
ncbi:MAG: DUF4123 domain-containing protein [Planctomycetota bacterium]|nr:DUF4123 domain-containing protein [Planctomycetota bacterium]